MFKLCVYYHDVLRYTIFGDLEKAHELRGQGFYVDVKAVSALGNIIHSSLVL